MFVRGKVLGDAVSALLAYDGQLPERVPWQELAVAVGGVYGDARLVQPQADILSAGEDLAGQVDQEAVAAPRVDRHHDHPAGGQEGNAVAQYVTDPGQQAPRGRVGEVGRVDRPVTVGEPGQWSVPVFDPAVAGTPVRG